jgi:hypothetical protein
VRRLALLTQTDTVLEIRVSALKNDWTIGTGSSGSTRLVEAVECFDKRNRGITTQSVDEFDIEFEKQREKSLTLSNAEPGDNRFAPYQNEHCIATGIERIMAAAIGVKWSDYETEINSL